MGQLGFCARIFRNVCTFLITCKIELRGRSNLPPDRRLGQRWPAVVCPPPVVARSVFARHSPAIRPCVHSLPLVVVWGRVPARYGASYSRCCSLADQISHALGVLRIAPCGVAPFDAALPGYSFHWCFFMSTQPFSRKVTPSSVKSARWSGNPGARRPAWLTTRWHG